MIVYITSDKLTGFAGSVLKRIQNFIAVIYRCPELPGAGNKRQALRIAQTARIKASPRTVRLVLIYRPPNHGSRCVFRTHIAAGPDTQQQAMVRRDRQTLQRMVAS